MPKSLPLFPFSFRNNEVIGCFWRYFGWDYSLIGKIIHLEVLIREFRYVLCKVKKEDSDNWSYISTGIKYDSLLYAGKC